jgi:hypothetical protein
MSDFVPLLITLQPLRLGSSTSRHQSALYIISPPQPPCSRAYLIWRNGLTSKLYLMIIPPVQHNGSFRFALHFDSHFSPALPFFILVTLGVRGTLFALRRILQRSYSNTTIARVTAASCLGGIDEMTGVLGSTSTYSFFVRLFYGKGLTRWNGSSAGL